MAIVTGRLRDFGLEAMTKFRPKITFTPSGPGVSDAGLWASRSLVITPDGDGYFSDNIQTTDYMHNLVWLTLSVEWLDEAGNFTRVDYPDWKIFVPYDGGSLSDIAGAFGNYLMVYTGTSAPPFHFPNMWWFNPSTDDLFRWAA